jgi:ubiquitin
MNRCFKEKIENITIKEKVDRMIYILKINAYMIEKH